MKLYASAKLSPFAARVRLPVYAKALPVEILTPPGGGDPRAPGYRAVNPIGKIPSLVLDDGTVIPESDTIVEFFADAFPDAHLRPTGAAAIARGRLLARISELYVLSPALRVFGQMDPATHSWRLTATTRAAFAEVLRGLNTGLGHLDQFATGQSYAAAEALTTADCALVPTLAFLGVFADASGRSDFLAEHPKVASYWASVQRDPSVVKVANEIRQGLTERIRAET